MIIISQKLFVTQKGNSVKVQFVDNPPINFAVWRLEIEGNGKTFNTFSELIEHLNTSGIFSADELKEIENAKDSLLNTGQI